VDLNVPRKNRNPFPQIQSQLLRQTWLMLATENRQYHRKVTLPLGGESKRNLTQNLTRMVRKSGAVELTIKTDGPSTRSSVDQLHPPFLPPQRSPRTNTFREASMNSLDDALSRIKGALDHMHEPPPSEEKKSVTTESQQPRSQPPTPVPPPQTLKPEPPKPSRWLPPALRPRDHVSNPFGLDVEEYVTKQPLSVPPSEVATVVVPKVGVARGPLTKRQLVSRNVRANGVRWDILTWDPPVEGMNKRDFSLNEVLFRRPGTPRGGSGLASTYLDRKTQGSGVQGKDRRLELLDVQEEGMMCRLGGVRNRFKRSLRCSSL
jgi:hypothetical protein